jgi:hypothetical protein
LEAQNIVNQGDSREDAANAAKNFGDTSNREESWLLMVFTCSSKLALSLSHNYLRWLCFLDRREALTVVTSVVWLKT